MGQHITIKELPDSEKPYEKFLNYGPEHLSDAELLAVIIKSGTNGLKSVEVAQNFLNQKNRNLMNLYDVSYEDMIKKGNEYYQTNNYNEAISYFTKATILRPNDNKTLLKIGNIYNLIGNEEKAIAFYELSVDADSEFADGWFNLGLGYAKAKRAKDSIKCFEKVISLTPDYPYSYYALGMAYETLGYNFNAIENYTLYKGFESDEKMLQTIDAKIKQLEK